MRTLRVASLAALVSAVALTGCSREGCLEGDDATKCTVPSPCPKLAFACDGGKVTAKVIAKGDAVPGGQDALAAVGDVLIESDQLSLVIENLNNANYLGTTGGNILDLASARRDDDGLVHILPATGILPGDQIDWTSLEILPTDATMAAVQVRGHLDGRPNVKVAQRYEVRPCEPGVRVRMEIVNLGKDPEMWTVMDAYYWSGKSAVPFAPGIANEGFRHDGFDLLTIDAAYKKFPWLGWSTHSVAPNTSYSSVACNVDTVEGFNSDQISTAGLPHSIVLPGDYQVFERFIAVKPGNDVASAAAVALEVRRQLFGETSVTLRGRMVRAGGIPLDSGEARAALLVSEAASESTPVAERIPWTQVVPGIAGQFEAKVPAHKKYVLDLQAFGRSVGTQAVEVGDSTVELGDVVFPLVGRLDVSVLDPAGKPLDARVVLTPADDATREATNGRLFGAFAECTPFLGPQHGPSPACNQVLLRGFSSFEVPSGNFHVYATSGPFWTIGRETVTVKADRKALHFTLQPVAVQPAGTLNGDFHVHGRSSFDSAIPDMDRVLSFGASHMQVIAATDHDVIEDYAIPMRVLGLTDQMVVMAGLETTGHIPWFTNPGSVVPRVIGHYNFWPLAIDRTLPRRGAPEDERIDPGALFTRVDPLFQGHGVIELNHPWADPEFGRDLGYPRAVGLDCTKPLPMKDDGTGTGRLFRKPAGSRYGNSDHDAQEVMNGSKNNDFLQYRAVWHCYLNNGLVKAGTANSDSHSLADNVLGIPRNVVYTKEKVAGFDAESFNESVRRGRMLGTNGPIIEATLAQGGKEVGPSTDVLTPAADAVLEIRVSAAPWTPVREVRIVVNGETVKTFKDLKQPENPFGTEGLERLKAEVKLSDVLPAGTKDSWLVVEAGEPLPLAGDLDKNGIPDTGDNDGNGVVDAQDTKDKTDTAIGPLDPPPPPKSDTDPGYHFAVVNHGGLPQAFTNPFIFDRDGGGFSGPGVGGGN